ncbi:MAG: hypothetical protein VXX85_06205 [Candidatus Margulisiibacteriota bacterium]|nr:hypothetical protein [Candidatus Margulisiibacteriota bacterium]
MPHKLDAIRQKYYQKLISQTPVSSSRNRRNIEFSPITLDDKIKQVTLSDELWQKLQLITKEDVFFTGHFETFEIQEIESSTKLSESLKNTIFAIITELNITDEYVIKINTMNKKITPFDFFEKFSIHLDWFNRQFDAIRFNQPLPVFETCMIYCGKVIQPTKIVPFCPTRLLRQFNSLFDFHNFQLKTSIKTVQYESPAQWIPSNLLHQAPERTENSIVISFRSKNEISHFS